MPRNGLGHNAGSPTVIASIALSKSLVQSAGVDAGVDVGKSVELTDCSRRVALSAVVLSKSGTVGRRRDGVLRLVTIGGVLSCLRSDSGGCPVRGVSSRSSI